MAKLTVGQKCIITEELQHFVASFKRVKMVCKKKYKKYLGQSAQVLSMFTNGTVMLKMEDGLVFNFPSSSIKRAKRNEDEWCRNQILRRHSKNHLIPPTDRSSGDRFKSSTSRDEMLKQEGTHEKPKSPKCIVIKQSSDAADYKLRTKEPGEIWNVLEALNLNEYHENLVGEGFESLDYLKHVTFSDLVDIGLKRGHARRLLRAMREYRANPSIDFRANSKKLQKRWSLCSSLTSTTSSSMPSISISHSSIPEYEQYLPNDSEHFLRIDKIRTNNEELIDHEFSGGDLEACLIRRRSTSLSFSDSSPSVIGRDEGYLVIPFTKRPLGFGIMFPLSDRAIVSSIMDEGLKIRGLCLGLPLHEISGINICEYAVDEVVNMLSYVKLPFTVTFSLTPYFKTGERVMVLKLGKWYPCTIAKMSKNTRKVTVTYDGSPFRLNNTEKISDYSRIKHFDIAGPEIAQQSSPHKVLCQTQCSPRLVSNKARDVVISTSALEQSPVITTAAAHKESDSVRGNKKSFGRKRHLALQQKTMTTDIYELINGKKILLMSFTLDDFLILLFSIF